MRRLALRIREILDGLGFVTFVKTSGRTGLHLYLPIARDLDFDAARGVAETIARHVQRERPKDVTVEWSVRRRTGKIFFVPDRLEAEGDVWAGILDAKQDLAGALGASGAESLR